MQQAPGRAQSRVVVGEAEPGEAGDAVLPAERLERLGVAEGPARPPGQRAADAELRHARGHTAVGRLAVQELARVDPRELVRRLVRLHRDDLEQPGAEFGPGERHPIIRPRARAVERDGGAGVDVFVGEQRLVGEGAGGDHSGDVPLHDTLGLRRVLDLLADGDAVAGLDHAAEVALDAVVRHARHGDALGALGEGHAQRAVGEDRVVVEHLVEVAHAEEEHAAGCCFLKRWNCRMAGVSGLSASPGDGLGWDFLEGLPGIDPEVYRRRGCRFSAYFAAGT